MIVVAPFWVARTTASITALVPVANFSNSKTPTGLQKKQLVTSYHVIVFLMLLLPVPNNCFGSLNWVYKMCNCIWSTIQAHPTFGNSRFNAGGLCGSVLSKFVCAGKVHRKMKLHPIFLCFSYQILDYLGSFLVEQRITDLFNANY